MKKENLIINISISILVVVGFFFIYKTSSDVLNDEYKKQPTNSSSYVELHPMIVESEANSVPPLKRVVKKSLDGYQKVSEKSMIIGSNDDDVYESEEDNNNTVNKTSDDSVVSIETTVRTITTSIERFISDDKSSDKNEKKDPKKPIATTIRRRSPFTITPLNDTSKGVILSKDPTANKTPVVVAKVDIDKDQSKAITENIDSYQADSTYLSGSAIDGYLKNAIVCLDLNGDGYCNISEEPSTNTDENGSYRLTITKAQRNHKNFDKAMVIVFDGVDIDTGKRFEGKLVSVQNDEGSINLSPITTLVAQKVKLAIVKNKDISSNQIQDQIQDAQKKVARLLNIDEKEIGEDPVKLHENGDSELLQKSLQLQKSVETLVITAKKESSLDTATITENIYEALASSLDTTEEEVALDLDKENVEQSPKSKNKPSKKPIALIEDDKKSSDGISTLLDNTKKIAQHDDRVKDLLGGEKSVEMVSVAKQMSKNVKTAFEEINSEPEEERHIVALSVHKDLQEVKKSLNKVVDIDQISENIVITPDDNRFEDKDWGRKYIEDDLTFIGEPCVEILVFKVRNLLLSKYDTIRPGLLLDGADSLLSESEDADIQRVYKKVLQNRNKNLMAKNELLKNASSQVVVNIVDSDPINDSGSILSKLLSNHTYYAVEENRENLLKVSFDKPSLHEVSIEELNGEQRSIVSTYSVENGHLSVPINHYDFIFISKEKDYILFEDGRRMYYSFEKAKEFVDSFSVPKEESASEELLGTLKGGLYYAVEEGRGDLLEVSFDDPDDGLVTIQELSGDQRVATVPYTVENNHLSTPINEYVFTFIKNAGNYLLFEDGRRMYYSEEEARSFIEEFDTPMF